MPRKKQDRIRAAFYLPDLNGGGAERAVVNLCRELPRHGVNPSVLLNRRTGRFLSLIPADVPVIELGGGRTLAALPHLTRYLRRENPEILISCTGCNNIIALWASRFAGRKTKTVIWQQNTMSREVLGADDWQYRLLNPLSRTFLTWADVLVAVSEGVAQDMREVLRRPSLEVPVIYNPAALRELSRLAEERVDHPWFRGDANEKPVVLGVGRLAPQKNFELLIDAFVRVSSQSQARLVIIGEGPLEGVLRDHIKRAGLAHCADILKFTSNPWRFMKRASVVAMSSHYEGCPNVLVEALACGTPVVSTDCPHGPREILGDGRHGHLVPCGDADALGVAILGALRTARRQADLIARAQDFSSDRIAEAFRGLFDRVLA